MHSSSSAGSNPVSWIQVDTDKALGRDDAAAHPATPSRIAAHEQLIVELYSK